MSLAGKRVIISGGAGFLGSYMVERLLGIGAEVTAVDDLSTGRVENLKAVMENPKFKLMEADASEVDANGYDIHIHGASIPSPDDYMKRPIKTALSNALGLLNFLKSSRRVLYMSSSEVYGDPQVIPTPENYWGNVNPVGQRSPYDESKRFGEALCMAFHREKGVGVKIARIHNTYGPRMDPQGRYARAIPRFIRQSLKGEPITIYGDGSQTRSFTYVDDMVEGLMHLLLSDFSGPINLGSESEVSVMEVANIIKELTGSRSELAFMPLPPDDPKRRRPDISLARKELKWQPEVSLREGLGRTVEWFRGELR
ncbi:MAG: NAD-dependent epimerase/dehydratase family protein [Nitrososphaerota archaeon]|jgi:nucleoside-diphosphate-sugar epimerase|nr:NAD-dependent epimerase/dehydratase family protein [Nitrososphaerota archaeon]MDG6931131.1 NAD-dependent epimerase/dehydratase family protein [Nitrososphaerota archaeon]